VNCHVEQCLCANSGVSEYEARARFREFLKPKARADGFDPTREELSQQSFAALFGLMAAATEAALGHRDNYCGGFPGRGRRAPPGHGPRVEEVVSVSPAALVPLFGGSDAEIERIGAALGTTGTAGLRQIVEGLRAALVLPDAQFKNPFVGFVVHENSVAKQFFEGRLNFAALLNTEECKFLVEKFRDGADFETVCSALEASNHNVGSARDRLAQ
jgi:hypothetical protein